MRYKATFIAGIAVGYIAGTRAGRARYDQLMCYWRQIATHPKVTQAASKASAKATGWTKTAAAKAPDYAKNAATAAAKTASTQVPKLVSNARQAASDKIPTRFGGTREGSAPDAGDVAPDGNLVYPANGSPSANGANYPPELP